MNIIRKESQAVSIFGGDAGSDQKVMGGSGGYDIVRETISQVSESLAGKTRRKAFWVVARVQEDMNPLMLHFCRELLSAGITPVYTRDFSEAFSVDGKYALFSRYRVVRPGPGWCGMCSTRNPSCRCQLSSSPPRTCGPGPSLQTSCTPQGPQEGTGGTFTSA
ncbi:hypothetical protein [Thermogymnomonas acidicola]|uniref:hypothetical protein n=1 Tax=Thermogymnomonas acidicola TaxID=399579 RepID=UPI00094620E2|nr:hypothetical protein [Thermogymnomonas acidicola]